MSESISPDKRGFKISMQKKMHLPSALLTGELAAKRSERLDFSLIPWTFDSLVRG
jgi:hypothetical protein